MQPCTPAKESNHMPQEDYYQVLGIDPKANTKQIKEAYRQMAFKFHPDRNAGNPAAVEKMKSVNEAYAVLSDPLKKREYDALRNRFGASASDHFRNTYSQQDIFSGSDINHIFEEMARAFGFRGFSEIFKEFYGQGYQQFEFKKPGFSVRGFAFGGPFKPGSQFRGPVRMRDNFGKISRYLLKKIGGVQLPENGRDIHAHLHLDPQQAQHGGPYAYYLRQTGKKLVVKIPPGIRDGQRIRLAGMGQDGRGGGKAGDLFLKVHVRRPLLQSVKNCISKLLKI
jgi:DnaJ-class molecular chaperone